MVSGHNPLWQNSWGVYSGEHTTLLVVTVMSFPPQRGGPSLLSFLHDEKNKTVDTIAINGKNKFVLINNLLDFWLNFS